MGATLTMAAIPGKIYSKFTASRIPRSASGHYSIHSILKGHVGDISCLAGNGTLLASGGMQSAFIVAQLISYTKYVGYDGVCVWRVDVSKTVPDPGVPIERGELTSICWIKRGDEPDDGIAFGTGAGYVTVWMQRGREDAMVWALMCNLRLLALIRLQQFEETDTFRIYAPPDRLEQAAIMGVAYDDKNHRLAVAALHGVVQLHGITKDMKLVTIWSMTIEKYQPMAIGLTAMTNGRRDVLAFGAKGGMCVLRSVHSFSS
jgi:hypothetical protein